MNPIHWKANLIDEQEFSSRITRSSSSTDKICIWDTSAVKYHLSDLGFLLRKHPSVIPTQILREIRNDYTKQAFRQYAQIVQSDPFDDMKAAILLSRTRKPQLHARIMPHLQRVINGEITYDEFEQGDETFEAATFVNEMTSQYLGGNFFDDWTSSVQTVAQYMQQHYVVGPADVSVLSLGLTYSQNDRTTIICTNDGDISQAVEHAKREIPELRDKIFCVRNETHKIYQRARPLIRQLSRNT